MSLPAAPATTTATITIAAGDNAAFWTAMASIITLPSGITDADVNSVTFVQNSDSSIRVILNATT